MQYLTEQSRREFLKTSAGLFVAGTTMSAAALLAANQAGNQNERPQFAIIGTGWRPDIKRLGRGIPIARQALKFGDLAAICEVDKVAGTYANQILTENKAALYEDYEDVLARDDIDAVLIATPDHWHTKIAIEAMRSGKDVYCEKPLTLTIDEGKKIGRVVKETGRVFQVGTQQRSENNNRFLTAVALVQSGRIGNIKRVSVGIDEGLNGGPFQVTEPPTHLNWDKWLGPAEKVPYIKERCHWTFRWWYEYSGGKLTDWGAHHVDIAQWAIGMQHQGPLSVEGTSTFPQELKNGYPTRPDMYNMPLVFEVKCLFSNGVEMVIHSRNNGILFEGDQGRFFVNRSKLTGSPVQGLEQNPISEEEIIKLYKGKQPGNHMGNFFDCLVSRDEPQSDVFTHHRTLSTCHLSNIALRLGRKMEWDYQQEQIVNDPDANQMLKREPREGFEIA